MFAIRGAECNQKIFFYKGISDTCISNYNDSRLNENRISLWPLRLLFIDELIDDQTDENHLTNHMRLHLHSKCRACLLIWKLKQGPYEYQTLLPLAVHESRRPLSFVPNEGDRRRTITKSILVRPLVQNVKLSRISYFVNQALLWLCCSS